MKTEAKNLDRCQVKLTVTLDAEEMKSVVKEVERGFVRNVRLPGFRPGKTPIEIIRKTFAQQLREETEHTMFRNHIGNAVKAEKLDEVALSEVSDFKVNPDGGEFVAVVEVRPTFKLPAYKGLKIEKKDVTVSDEQVNDQMNRLRTAYAKFEDAKEGEAVAKGDFVQIDYSGTVDKKPILEVAPDAKIVAMGNGFWTQVEDGRFLPEILDVLVGMKIGESKTGVKATFDKEAAPEPLKGKKALYDVTLKSFRRRILPTDAEFVEKTKAESLEKLAASVRESMQKQADEEERVRRENDAIEQLLKKADFDVPGTQVRRATDAYLKQLAERAQHSGLNAEYFDKNRDRILKDAEDAARRQVRLWYVIEAIAAAEKIEAADDEKGKKVVEFVLANSK